MSDFPRRKEMRWAEYDYTQNGLYFVTVCVQHRLCLFGDIVDSTVQISPAGEMINELWQRLAVRYSGIDALEMVVMPNHIHGIVRIDTPEQSQIGLAQVIRWFKTMTTNAYIHGVNEHGWQPFNKRLWQRNYYDHVIRNEAAAREIHRYIAENPARWGTDPMHG